MNNKIGVILSGGGARGLAHIGFLQALSEYGIHPSYISGCSSGAIVGCLFAAGHSSEEMRNYFQTNSKMFSLSKVSIRKNGIFDSDKYISTLDPYIKNDSFEALDIKLIINATDILKGETVYFSEGNDLKRKVIASAAVPGIFSPIELGKSKYVDGGTMDNFPVKPLMAKELITIGSYLSMHRNVTHKEMSNSLKLANRASHLAFNAKAISQLKLCDHIIAPKSLSNYTLFDTDKFDEIYQIGYSETIKYLKQADIKIA